jgi:NitT/TauT family transport system substrate-binding protein
MRTQLAQKEEPMKPNHSSTANRQAGDLSRRRFLQWTGAAGLALAAAPVLASCGSDDPATAGGKVKLIHASQDPLVLWAVTYLAEDSGFYKDEGLEVERVLLAGGPPALTALIAGNGLANLSAPGELLAAADKGQDLRILMAHTNAMPGMLVVSKEFAAKVGVTADSPLATRTKALAQASKPRIGITAPGSLTDALGRLALVQAGLDPATQAQIVPLGTASNSIAAMANNQIDGFFAFSPGAETAITQLGAVPLLVNQTGEIEGGDRLQGMTVQARAADVEANKATYQAVVRADVKAMKSLLDAPDEAARLLRRTRFGALDETVWTMTWSRIQAAWKTPYVRADSLAAWFDAGLIGGGKADGKAFPYDRVLDMTFVDAAVAGLNWAGAKQ